MNTFYFVIPFVISHICKKLIANVSLFQKMHVYHFEGSACPRRLANIFYSQQSHLLQKCLFTQEVRPLLSPSAKQQSPVYLPLVSWKYICVVELCSPSSPTSHPVPCKGYKVLRPPFLPSSFQRVVSILAPSASPGSPAKYKSTT